MTRQEMIEEVDLALAALRRVIVRAIDVQPGSSAAERPAPRPKAAPAEPQPPKPERPPQTIHGITICATAPAYVTYRARRADVTPRQAELVIVLATASGKGWLPRATLTERAWPEIAKTSRDAYLSTCLPVLVEKLAPLGLRLKIEKGFGVSPSIPEAA